MAIQEQVKAKQRSLIPIILLAVLVFGATLVFLLSLRADTNVVVAKRPISIGARLTENDVEIVPMRSVDALPNVAKSLEDVVGQVVSIQRAKGDQITKDMLGEFGISAISAALAPDHRAIAVQVNKSSGLAGIVRPGDLVTLIGIVTPPDRQNGQGTFASLPALSLPSAANSKTAVPPPTPTPIPDVPPPSSPFSRVMMTGLKVLLVPQNFRYKEVTDVDKQGFALAQNSSSVNESSVLLLDVPVAPIQVQGPRGVLTVSVPELIALLQTNGKIYLAMEPLSASKVQTVGVSIEQLVDVLGVGVAEGGPKK